MQQKPPKSFSSLYKQICRYSNVAINQTLKSGIGDTDITIILESIDKTDLDPLNQLLSQCKFKSISLKSNQRTPKLNKSLIQEKNELTEILRMIAQLFAKSLDILSLIMSNLRFSNEQVVILAQGIAAVQSLKELRIIQCSLGTNQFSLLQPALMQNSSLICLDLSHNLLTGPCGILLFSLLLEHSKRRDRVEWVYKSRGEDPEEDISLIGICDLNLSYNKLNCQFVKDLAPHLEKDRWLKSINLKHNIILKEGLDILLNCLDKNFSLISLDIRSNLGTTAQIQKDVYRKLVRNKTKSKSQPLEQQEGNEDVILANVSAIPNTLQNSQNSYDQESPVMSFGVFEYNGAKHNSSSLSKQFQFKSGLKNDSSCIECTKLQSKLKRQHQMIKLLKQENQYLKTQLQTRTQNQQSNQMSQSFQPQSSINVLNLLDNNHNQMEQEIEQDDMMNRIEQMMNELTRMMDSLDGQGSATNNLTAHLSSTMIGQNNNTRVIFERPDLNNEQLINILGQNSHDSSDQDLDTTVQ